MQMARSRGTAPETRADAAGAGRERGAAADVSRRPLVGAMAALALLAVLAVALHAACSGAAQGRGESGVVLLDNPGPQVSGTQGAQSTPRDQWRKGSMPYLYQIDPRYANATYSGGSFARQGCGPSALSMAYIYLTGKTDLGPLEMARFATENGYSTDQNGSSWTLVSEGAKKLGLSVSEVSADPARMREALESGRVLVCVMAPGTFTRIGHYVVVERLAEDGSAVVHDSNSVERSNQTWDLGLICEEASAIWSLGAD